MAKRQLVGTVVSDKGDKTIVVSVSTRKTHPLYRKQYTISKKFMAHDEKNEAGVGDKVSIIETAPMSRRKHHLLERVIEKPKLSLESLAATKAEEQARPASKKKSADEDEVAAAPEKTAKKTAKTEQAPVKESKS